MVSQIHTAERHEAGTAQQESPSAPASKCEPERDRDHTNGGARDRRLL